MPTILAIETSSELASAALFYDGRLTYRDTAGVKTHSQTLLPMVQQLLVESGIALSRCDAIAFGSGPGSFTGVRTACGVAQGLAFGADLPVIPIVTLLAMAESCRTKTGASDVLTILDARMNEVYWAQYRHASGGWQVVTEPALSPAGDVTPVGEALACGNGLAAYASQLERFAKGAAMPEEMPHAGSVAAIAMTEFEKGNLLHAREARPLYLRNKVALTTEERRARVVA